MININPAECDLCGCCVGVCPEDALELNTKKLIVLEELCTGCSQCIWACPVEALEIIRIRANDE